MTLQCRRAAIAMLSGLGLFQGLVGSRVALAAKAPRPVLTDTRIKQVLFDPNQVYEVAGTYGYQTAIEFGHDEAVKVVSLGDSIAWQAVPYRNRLFLKPVEPNASTNLTVITDRRTYFFRLRSAAASQPMTFVVRFVYPGSGSGDARHRDTDEPTGPAGPAVGLAKLNFDYGQSGDRAAIPLTRAFDDGQFTYLLFDKDGDVPAVYLVAPDGTESVVNTRREGQYLVVERVAARFTLRSGKAYLCLQNHRLPARAAVPTAGGGNG